MRRLAHFPERQRRVGEIDLDATRATWAEQPVRRGYDPLPRGPARIVVRTPVTGAELGARLRERDLTAAPAALNLLENRSVDLRPEGAALLAEVAPGPARRRGARPRRRRHGSARRGQVDAAVGAHARLAADGRTVAVLAVDPTSKRSGGALLGDRARIDGDPADRGLFIRSTAAGERLGGLAPATRAAAQALAAAFDVVVIETVGVGQSETEVAEAADTVAVVVQPGSGDVLQFLKAGIMEVPDVLVVTKADLGQVAVRPGATSARRCARSASATCRSSPSPRSRRRRDRRLVAALDAHRSGSTCPRRAPAPAASARSRTSCPSTGSAACAPSAAAAPPSAGSPSRTPASRSPR